MPRAPLDVASQDGLWRGSRKVAEWEVFKDNKDTRSEWTHPSGLLVTVFGYPLGPMEVPEQFKREYEQAMLGKKSKLVRADEAVPGAFHGFRQIRQADGNDGQPVALLEYFLYDSDGNDVHEVLTAVPVAQTAIAERLLGDFLTHARWVDPVPPQR